MSVASKASKETACVFCALLCLLVGIPSAAGQTYLSPNATGPIGNGFDLSNGAIRAPLFLFTDCGTYVSQNGPYALPCEAIAVDEPVLVIANTSKTLYTLQDYQLYAGDQWPSTGSNGTMSQTSASTTWYLSYFEEDYSLTLVSDSFFLTSVEIANYMDVPLDPTFRDVLDDLNAHMKTVSYDDIVNRIIIPFGSHFTPVMNLGGKLVYACILHNCYARTYGTSWVEEQADAFFDIQVQGYSETVLSSTFSESTYREDLYYVYGGTYLNATIVPNSVSDWIPTIAEEPIVLEGTWLKISQLVAPIYPILAKRLTLAIDQYLDSKALSVQQSVMTVFPVEPSWNSPEYCPVTCPSTCGGQFTCPGSLCTFPVGCEGGLSAHDLSGCGDDDDDHSTQECVNYYNSLGYCAQVEQGHSNHMCLCSFSSAGSELVGCSSGCYPE